MVMTLEIPNDLRDRLESEAAKRGLPVEQYCRQTLDEVVPAIAPDAEFQEQMRIARRIMHRYSNTFRELAK